MINQLIQIADSIMPNTPDDLNSEERTFIFEVMLMRLDSKLSGYTQVDDFEVRCFIEENSPLFQGHQELKAKTDALKKDMDAFADTFIKLARQSEPWSDILGEVYKGLGFSYTPHNDAKKIDVQRPMRART